MVLQAGCQGCPSVKAHVGYLVSKTKFGVLAVALLPQTESREEAAAASHCWDAKPLEEESLLGWCSLLKIHADGKFSSKPTDVGGV